MAVQLLTGVGRPWPSEERRVQPWGPPLEQQRKGALKPQSWSPISFSHPDVVVAIGEERRQYSWHCVPSLSDLGLDDFTLVLLLRPSSHHQSNTNKQKGGKKNALQSNKAKLYCLNSHLSILKECIRPEIGTVAWLFCTNQKQRRLCFGNMLSLSLSLFF